MASDPSVPVLRDLLSRAGWCLTEMAGGPWIIYGYHGEAPLCVMGEGRMEAWRKAWDHAALQGLLTRPGGGKGSAA